MYLISLHQLLDYFVLFQKSIIWESEEKKLKSVDNAIGQNMV